MHKLFHISEKKLSAVYTKRILILNIPTAAAAVALVLIVNAVMRGVRVPMELYRAVYYSLEAFVFYSFSVSLVSEIMCSRLIKVNSEYTFMEISGNTLIVSQHEKNVAEGLFDAEEYIRLWVMKLTDVEDVYADKGKLFIKGRARYFCMPARWLRYNINEEGKICFEHPWNDDFGGETVQLIKVKDYYTFGERILKRILFCAEKNRITEKRREEFRKKMLAIAKKTGRRKGFTQKYKEPRYRGPREGVKKRNW